MKGQALVSFSGKISMAMGQIGDITDESLANDLIRAGYVTSLDAPKKEAKPKEAKPKTEEKVEDVKTTDKPKTKRKGKTDGN